MSVTDVFYSHCFVLSAPLVHDEGDEGSRRTPSGDEREAGGDAVGQGEVPARHRHGTAAAGSLVGVVEREVATELHIAGHRVVLVSH